MKSEEDPSSKTLFPFSGRAGWWDDGRCKFWGVQWCGWGNHSSGIWYSITGYTVPIVLKDCSFLHLDWRTMILWNVTNHLPHDAISYPRTYSSWGSVHNIFLNYHHILTSSNHDVSFMVPLVSFRKLSCCLHHVYVTPPIGRGPVACLLK